MSGLLAAQNIALLEHHFEHIAVADVGALNLHAILFGVGVQSHVGQNGGNKCTAAQLAFLLHVRRADCHNAVAVQLLAGLVYDQAAVSIAVKGNAKIKIA